MTMNLHDFPKTLGALGLLALCGLGVIACPASLDDRCAEGACTPGGNPDGSTIPTEAGPPPDPCVDTPNDPKCLDEESALFVSASAANTSGAGTKAAPFKTISAALAKVTAEKKRIYVCAGDYPEQLSIETSVSILGGFACSWTEAGPKARIVPAKGVAVTIKNAQTVALASLEIEAKADPNVPGDSAIGVFVSTSTGVLLKDAVVRAGPGTDGKDGPDGSASPNYVNPVATSGIATANATGAQAPACEVCSDQSKSIAGKGADSSDVPETGTAQPPVGTPNEGASRANGCDPGGVGASGESAVSQDGALTPGALSANGWATTSDAKKGGNGRPGQGGGGGGSRTMPSALGGGSGGCGGCGGTGGGPGESGGSSFALLSFNAEVVVSRGELSSGKGGAGGSGGAGQEAQSQGAPGAGACLGGAGGAGAGGGGGGGGAGGHSVAIGYVGSAPRVEGASLQHQAGGNGGTGGTGGLSSGNSGLNGGVGADGTGAETLKL